MATGGSTRLFLAAWGIALVVGFGLMARYENTPGVEASAPVSWPSSTRIAPATAGRSTLLLFAHPKCPCTEATLHELAAVLERHAGRADTRVLFVRPPGVEADWEKTDLWHRASKIAGVRVLVDGDAEEATRFGVHTSGQVLLFAPDGLLVFSGGITESRGHEGDNGARQALEAALDRAAGLASARPVPAPPAVLADVGPVVDSAKGPAIRTPVFGCSLLVEPCSHGNSSCRR